MGHYQSDLITKSNTNQQLRVIVIKRRAGVRVMNHAKNDRPVGGKFLVETKVVIDLDVTRIAARRLVGKVYRRGPNAGEEPIIALKIYAALNSRIAF